MNGGEGFPDGRLILADPGIVCGAQRLADVALGVGPATERLLGEAELRSGARALAELIGPLEVRQRRCVVALPTKLEPATNQRIFGHGRIGRGGRRRRHGWPRRDDGRPEESERNEQSTG